MGNHAVGQMFNSGVAYLSDEDIDNLTQADALIIIDRIGKMVVESTSLDAEFGDYANPNQKLGRVLIKAFIPHKYSAWKDKEYVDDDMDAIWYYDLWKPFTGRFGFW